MNLEHSHTDLSIIGKSFNQTNKSTECIISDSTPDLVNPPYSASAGKGMLGRNMCNILFHCFITCYEIIPGEFIVYKKRWLILIIFTFYSATNAVYWTQYTIIENIISR